MRTFLNPLVVESVINAAADKIFTIKFKKSNGSIRVMNARKGVKKHLKGCTKPKKAGIITVFDMQLQAYRSISIDRVIEIRARGTKTTTIK
jgi:hypothetical protein